MDDLVRELGYLTLGSRLKRIGERLQADTARLSESVGIPIQPPQHLVLAALDRHGPLTVGELVAVLGVSQPGVTRTLARLIELDLVALQRGAQDNRQKVATLTGAGDALVANAKAVLWPAVAAAVADVCAGLDGPLLGQLDAIEDALAQEPLDVRAGRVRP